MYRVLCGTMTASMLALAVVIMVLMLQGASCGNNNRHSIRVNHGAAVVEATHHYTSTASPSVSATNTTTSSRSIAASTPTAQRMMVNHATTFAKPSQPIVIIITK
jgi:hypothetical protein